MQPPFIGKQKYDSFFHSLFKILAFVHVLVLLPKCVWLFVSFVFFNVFDFHFFYYCSKKRRQNLQLNGSLFLAFSEFPIDNSVGIISELDFYPN